MPHGVSVAMRCTRVVVCEVSKPVKPVEGGGELVERVDRVRLSHYFHYSTTSFNCVAAASRISRRLGICPAPATDS